MTILSANALLISEGVKTVADAPENSVNAQIAELTRQLAKADEQAFRKFHEQYFDRLYQFLFFLTRGHETEEALQDTFLRVVRYARPFGTEDAFWSWLKMLARSAARDRQRKQRRYTGLIQKLASHLRASADPCSTQEEDRMGALLQEALLQLCPFDRELMERKYFECQSVKAVADDTKLSEKAVESRLLRSRRIIRHFILKRIRNS